MDVGAKDIDADVDVDVDDEADFDAGEVSELAELEVLGG